MLGDMYPNRSQDQKPRKKWLIDSFPPLRYANIEEEIEFEQWTFQNRVESLLGIFDLSRGSPYHDLPISRVFGFLLEEMRKEKRTGKKMDYDDVWQKMCKVKDELEEMLWGERE